MLPLSILPLVLAGCFLWIWAIAFWLKFEELLSAARRAPDAPERDVY